MLKKITYNSRCSLVVTDPTTNLPVGSLSMGERTGSRIFYRLWSYVPNKRTNRFISRIVDLGCRHTLSRALRAKTGQVLGDTKLHGGPASI